ncbi:MAG: DUF2130 domain-containing protein [Helicobacter sp.]|nr:DUF2130 domain-containing protein [Helicobacter sp.]
MPTIQCPNCKVSIDVNEILYHQLEEEMKQKNLELQKQFEKEREQQQIAYNEVVKNFELERKQFAQEKEAFSEKLQQSTKEALKEQSIKMREELKKEILEEHQESLEFLQKQLQEKSNQVKELNNAKVEIEQLKLANSEQESKLKVQFQKEFHTKFLQEKEQILKQMSEENELKLKEKNVQLEELKKQLKETQRRAELGSVQLQGEVQELAIEEFLRLNFPFDEIEEIKKGVKGGDCVQTIHTREIANCGKIYYESKRTREFQKSWIEKFKEDMRERGIELGVIVTETLPKELERMGLIEGVWICTFEEFKGLCVVLRESVIKISLARKIKENKADKMNLLYHYLTSEEFKMQIEAIVEGFMQLNSDLEREKAAMNKIWTQRKKQIDKVLKNTIGMYGSLQGIAGSSIANIKALELPYEE